MIELLSTLAGIGLSGLGFLAYRHPDAYRDIWGPLARGVVVAIGFCFMWNIACRETHSALAQYIPPASALAALNALPLIPEVPVMLGGVIFLMVLLVLRLLPAMLAKKP